MENNIRERNREICELLRSRTEKGMERLFDTYYKPMVAWANTFLRNVEEAADVVSEFFAVIWEKRLYLEFRAETLDTFMRVSVRNRCLHLLEKHDALRNAEVLDGVEEAFEEYNEEHDKIVSRVWEEVAALPERTREVVVAVFVEGLKYRRVAERLEISESTVKTLLGNAIKRLRDRLNEKEFREFLFLFCKRR